METVSLSEFAIILSVSEPTLRRRLADAPADVVLKRGTHGDAYEIDPAAGVRWWLELKAADDAEAAARRDRIGAMQLSLLGDDAALADSDVGGISAAEQKAALEAELAAIRLGKERGELVRADDVLARLSEFTIKIGSTFSSLPVRLARRVDVPPEVTAMLQQLINQDLNALANFAAGIEQACGSDSDADEAASRDHPLPPG